MKNKLLTCAILSTITSIGLILLIVAWNQPMSYDRWGIVDMSSSTYTLMATGSALAGFAGIADFVMGIIVLSNLNKTGSRGLAIATAVLSMLGGVFFAGSIVGFIAYKKDVPNTTPHVFPGFQNQQPFDNNFGGVNITAAGGAQPIIAPSQQVHKPEIKVKTLEEELVELQTLKEKKLITATEYTAMRKKLLDKSKAK